VHDYVLHEMAKIRADELREEAARETRGSQGWRRHLGILAGPQSTRREAAGFARGTMEEACCA
jgi:hypothetical protein